MNIEVIDILLLLQDDTTYLYIFDKSKCCMLFEGVPNRDIDSCALHAVVQCIDVGENEHGPYIYLEV